jgi:serine/threonine-protein kinase
VRRDSDQLGPGQWGSAVPVDPGKHVLSATAPGRADWSTTIEVPEGKVAEVEVPALAVVSSPPEAAKLEPTPAPPAGDVGRADGESDANGRPTRRAIGLLVAGAGVVALGVGTYFGIEALSKNSDSNQGPDGCVGDMCRLTGYNTRNDARAAGDLSSIFIGAGAAAVVTGGVLWLTALPHRSGTGARPAIHVGIAPTGLWIEGGFR